MLLTVTVLVFVCAYLALAVLIGQRLRAVQRALFDFVRAKPSTRKFEGGRVLGLDECLNLVPNPGISLSEPEVPEKGRALSLFRSGTGAAHEETVRQRAAQPVNGGAAAMSEEALASFRAKRILGPLSGSFGLMAEAVRGETHPRDSGMLHMARRRMPIILK